MMEQAVMNPVVNARDAMSVGGELIIRTTRDTKHGILRESGPDGFRCLRLPECHR